ncbi:efflux transporter outer membrane subunit [Oxalobacteraceae bacterium CAVE-383]|nr:efflux transporter outer membrane subunit [Oxalobacteraceae bacterium CAVE-383]
MPILRLPDAFGIRLSAALALAVSLAACSTQPAYRQPDLGLPAAWANTGSSADAATAPALGQAWWKQLHDPAIDALIAAAYIDQPTLAQAAARVDEANATLGVNRAQQLPQAQLKGNAQRASSQNIASVNPPYTLISNSASIGPSLGWELDLWGRLRESTNAARRRLDARDADAQGAQLSIAAQIADGVLALRACNYALQVRDNDIASRDTELGLTRRRVAVGNAAPVDEANAGSNLANARTNRISQQEQCMRTVDALVALSGLDAAGVRDWVARPLPPGAATAVKTADADLLMPAPPAFRPALPANVLLNHPNVVSAEREAAASWAEIGVARANRLPRIDLSAMLTGQWLSAFGQSAHFDTWSVGAGLSAPLFDGGSGAANVRGAEARYRQAVATLRSTVRTTVQNIEDALAAQQSAEQRIVTSQQATDAARFGLRANEARWQAGAISRFELEDTRRLFNSAQESAIAAARDRAQAWVDLVRASGNYIDSNTQTR